MFVAQVTWEVWQYYLSIT